MPNPTSVFPTTKIAPNIIEYRGYKIIRDASEPVGGRSRYKIEGEQSAHGTISDAKVWINRRLSELDRTSRK